MEVNIAEIKVSLKVESDIGDNDQVLTHGE